jgi:hypothetical protein
MKRGGYIKFDKDVGDDPRLIQAAVQLTERYRVSIGDQSLSPGDQLRFTCNAVTGALVTLWKYADVHIRDDDTLPMTGAALDLLVGLVGFCEVLPREWLHKLDDGTVHLPGYCEKNTLIAKRKAAEKSNARVAAFRLKHKANGNGVTHTLPERISSVSKVVDPDPDLSKKEIQERVREEGHTPSNGVTSPLQNGHAREPWHEEPETPAPGRPTESEITIQEQMVLVKGLYPEGGREDWITAEHALRRLVREGFTWNEAQDVVIRYAKHCKATGNNVMNPAKFFTAHDKPWLQPWTIPKKESQKPVHRAAKSTAELEAEEAANAKH